VKPGSKRAGFTHSNGVLVLHVRERAVEGAANAACIRAIAGALGVTASRVELVRGARGRDKTFSVHGLDADDIAQRLRNASGI
jgi:hypothetical protein